MRQDLSIAAKCQNAVEYARSEPSLTLTGPHSGKGIAMRVEKNRRSTKCDTCPVPTDDQLFKRAVTGDKDAKGELLRRHEQAAYRVAYRRLGNEEDARDAVQESFLKAAAKLESFREESSFKTWLLRVVANAALDLGRQRGRHPTVRLDALQGPPRPRQRGGPLGEPTYELTAAEDAAREEQREAVRRAVAMLPPYPRYLYETHYEQDLTIDEISAGAGVSRSTVHRNLQALRARLKPPLEHLRPDINPGSETTP